MTIKNKYFLFLISFCLIFKANAQLGIYPILGQSHVVKDYSKSRLSAIGDTLNLPFIENFVSMQSDALWKENVGVFLNNNFGTNPPSIGVATLDGVDGTGTPYVFRPDKGSAAGIGDYIESKIIDLSQVNDNEGLAMSFFWQQGVFHDVNRDPRWKDGERLKLYFKDSTDVYRLVWPTPTIVNRIIATKPASDTFSLENVIIEPRFLHDGFQFKFEYYATLVGNYGVFTVDNIWIDKGIALPNGSFKEPQDYAFSKAPETILKDYSSVPINHFLTADANILKDSISAEVYSLDDLFIQDTDSSMQIFYEDSKLASFGSESFEFAFINRASPTKITWMIDKPALKNAINSVLKNKKSFVQTRVAVLTPDSVRTTDSSSSYTTFSDYYSYDDGTIEAGLGVKEVGEFVQSYDFLKDDAISGFYIYFPKYGLNLENTFITFNVYSKLEGIDGATSTVLEHSQNGVVEYSTDSLSLNKFIFIPFGTPLTVSAGKYYFGIAQTSENRVLVGLDYSNDRSENIFFRLYDDDWQSFASNDGYGCAAIRPMIFSQNIGVFEKNTSANVIKCFPNPTEGVVYFDRNVEYVKVYDLQGSLLNETKVEGNLVNLGGLQSGIYMLEMQSGETLFKQKIILK